MVQRSCGTCFLLEAAQAVWVAYRSRTENFDGDIAIQPAIASAIHISHAPGANFLEDSVMT